VNDLYDALGVPGELFRTDDDETPEERHDRAYMAFCHLPRKVAHGWAVRLSEVCGVPPSTLKKWRKSHQWDLRFAGEMARLNPELEKTGQAILRAGTAHVAERLLDIVDYGDNKEATAAIRVWSEMTGMTVRKPQQAPTVNTNVYVDTGQVRDYAKLSVEELFSQVKDQTQDNLDTTLVLRSGKVHPS
jgi:hypothetical protein